MIITVDPDRGFHDRIMRAVTGTPWATAAEHVGDPAAAADAVAAAGTACAVVVGPHVALPAATALAQRLDAGRVEAAVLLVTEPTTDVLRAAMRAGARDVLPPNFSDDDLRSALDRTGMHDLVVDHGPGLTVAVFSTKGGVGTSTVAANLAVRLAARTEKPSVLVDLDVASADQAIMHGLKPSWTLQDLVDGSVQMDLESLDQVLLPVGGSDTRILPGPVDPALAETISGEAVARVIHAARAAAPIVVLDTAAAFDDRTLAAIDASDVLVVVSSLDVAALRALAVSLQTLERIGVDRASIRVALVRADSKTGLQVADVERAIDRSVDARIPSTRAVPRALNEGVPLAVGAARSDYVRAIDDLVAQVTAGAVFEVAPGETPGSASGWRGFGMGRSPRSTAEPSAEVAARPASRTVAADPAATRPSAAVGTPDTDVRPPSTTPATDTARTAEAPPAPSEGTAGREPGWLDRSGERPDARRTELRPVNGGAVHRVERPPRDVAVAPASDGPPWAEGGQQQERSTSRIAVAVDRAEPVATRRPEDDGVTDTSDGVTADAPSGTAATDRDTGVGGQQRDVVHGTSVSLDDLPPPALPTDDTDSAAPGRRRGRRR